MCRKYVFALTLLVLLAYPSYGSSNEGYLEKLTAEKEIFEKALSKANNGSIYTELTRENKKPFLKKIFFEDEYEESQLELWKSGKRFLEYLENSNDEYHSLPFDDWKVAAGMLMDVDDISERNVGWGNLIIKLNILNKLFYWVFDYIEANKNNLDSQTLGQLIQMQRKIRKHIPSREATVYLALRHYGYSDYKEVDTFVLQQPVSKEGNALEKKLENYFDSQEKFQKAITTIIHQERIASIKQYTDLYTTPIPWVVAHSAALYLEFSWALYLYSKILQDKGAAFGAWDELTLESLGSILTKEYVSDGRFWMIRAASDAIKAPDIYAPRYLKSVIEGRTIETIRQHRRYGVEGKPVETKWFVTTKLP